MLSREVRVLNFDGSILRQKRLLERFHPEIIDFAGIGPSVRLWMNDRSARLIRAGLYPRFKSSPTFLGSGDFHNVSAILLEQYCGPVTVVSFDHHPDWDIFWPPAGCGSWVSRALENRGVDKVIILGIGSDDISTYCIQSANLSAMKDGKLEIYPYRHSPSRVFFRSVPDNPSLRVNRSSVCSDISWRQLADMDIDGFLKEIKGRIRTSEVYISIDKDCLKAEDSLTNWEEGMMGLDELLKMIRFFKDNFNLVGLDITGDYSRPEPLGWIKGFFSRLDHPRDYSACGQDDETVDRVNEETNIKILDLLLG